MVGENVTTTASFVGWIGRPHGSNLLYDTLWDQGCVFFARTTQPQCIMHLETSSLLYGRTAAAWAAAPAPGVITEPPTAASVRTVAVPARVSSDGT